MKFLITVTFILFSTYSFTQTTKPKQVVKTKTTITPKTTVVNSKVKDSITNLLTAGTWKMSYVVLKDKKKPFPDNFDEKQLPKMIFQKDGVFIGLLEGDDTKGTWTLSNDGKLLTTIEDGNKDTFTINKITSNELELIEKGETSAIMGFKLIAKK